MKRMSLAIVVLLGGLSATVSPAVAASSKTHPVSYDPEMNCTKKVWLSAAQKKQLNKIYYNIYRDYSQLIEAYAWAGALTPDQKKLRYKMLTNYYSTFTKRNYQWCSEHESDEWEEEWYNNDND